MIRLSLNRHAALALASGLLALILAPPPVHAQDGERRTEGPVTNPDTDKLIPRPDSGNPLPRTTADILPPVPATVRDPAPAGTLAVPPGQIIDENQTLTPAQAAARRQALAQNRLAIQRVEGVVIAIEQPKSAEGSTAKLPNEKVRLVIDPTQSWESFVASGPLNIKEDQSGPSATAPPTEGEAKKPNELVEAATAAVKAAQRELADSDTKVEPAEANTEPAAQEQPEAVDVVVTARTKVFVHARTEDGIDLLHIATASSPNVRPEGVGAAGRPDLREPRQMETNFTNIHVGSFVSVRYRTVGDVNQAVNVNLVEKPIIPPGQAAQIPGAEPVPVPQQGVSAIPTEGAEPVRVPVIPGRTVSPGGTIPR